MKSIPFPSTIIAMTSARARASIKSEQGRARVGDVITTSNTPAFRRADGRIQVVVDPYHPTYEDGCEPGLTTMQARLKYYPNDSTGYEYAATGFKTFDEARKEGMIIDDLAVVQLINDETKEFSLIVDTRERAQEKEAELLSDLGDQFRAQEPVIYRLGEPDQNLQVFMSFATRHAQETWGAPDKETLSAALYHRFNHDVKDLEPSDYEGIVERLSSRFAERDQMMICGTRDDLDLQLNAIKENRNESLLSL